MEELNGYMVGGYLPTTFLDWEGRVASVIFISGCNFRCPWCHNGSLVHAHTGEFPLEDILADIERRARFLDGVVISGGEPTLWDGLMPLLSVLSEKGLPVKLDTNGSNPRLLLQILKEELVAHVAMDIKAPFDEVVLERVTGVKVSPFALRESASIIKRLAPSYEFRTTWSPAILSEAELLQIGQELADSDHWIVQPFTPENCMDLNYRRLPKVSSSDIKRILPAIRVRG